MVAGRMGETRQKSHLVKYASDDLKDPNTVNPYAHHCILEKYIQQTEISVWYVRVGQGERSKHNQTNEASNNQESDRKDALKEYHRVEQLRAKC
jgi:hypothetical protein